MAKAKKAIQRKCDQSNITHTHTDVGTRGEIKGKSDE
jgi:hypothetical protein